MFYKLSNIVIKLLYNNKVMEEDYLFTNLTSPSLLNICCLLIILNPRILSFAVHYAQETQIWVATKAPVLSRLCSERKSFIQTLNFNKVHCKTLSNCHFSFLDIEQNVV